MCHLHQVAIPASSHRDIQERYRTLCVYNIEVSEEELTVVDGLEQQWKDLFVQAREVDKSLIKVKKKFTIVCSAVMLRLCKLERKKVEVE